MLQSPETMDLRLAAPEDDARIVEIINCQQGDSVPLTVARYRAEYAAESQEHPGERYVALRDGQVVGAGGFHWAWWTGDPGIYVATLCVDPTQRRRGIGTQLFHQLQSRLRMRGAKQVVQWIRSDVTGGLPFAIYLGFQETGRILQDYALKISEADPSAYQPLEARLHREGVRIASLSELPYTDLTFLYALQRLWADSSDDAPVPEQLQNSLESWQQEVLQAPGLSPETHWIALEGERPVGLTFLKQLNADTFENDYTGVAGTHRRRGIATALKLRSIVWTQQQGVQSFQTCSEINNAAMITVNTRAGYRPAGRQLEVTCKLEP